MQRLFCVASILVICDVSNGTLSSWGRLIFKLPSTMRELTILAVSCLLLDSTGCRRESNNPITPTNSGPLFAIRYQTVETGRPLFQAKPDLDVRLLRVIASTAQFVDTLAVEDSNTVISRDVWCDIGEIAHVLYGQQWSFTFRGYLGGTGASFTSTSVHIVGVAFSVQDQRVQPGSAVFLVKPNADVRITRAIVSHPAQQFADTLINPDPTQVFPKNSWVSLPSLYSNVQQGQLWMLAIDGTVAANSVSYATVSSYRMP